MFNGGEWPPNSPDMNPIEHVWPLVLQTLSGRVFSGREDLWNALQIAFGQITRAQIGRLYESMPRRLHALRAARGRHTRY
jgi:transposase